MMRHRLLTWFLNRWLDEGRPVPSWLQWWIRHDSQAQTTAHRLAKLDVLLSIPDQTANKTPTTLSAPTRPIFSWPIWRPLAGALGLAILALVFTISRSEPSAPNKLVAISKMSTSDKELMRAKLAALGSDTQRVWNGILAQLQAKRAPQKSLVKAAISQTREDGQRLASVLAELIEQISSSKSSKS